MDSPDIVAPQSRGLTKRVVTSNGSAPVAIAEGAQGVSPDHFWANTVMAAVGCVAGILALVLVLFRLDDYADRLNREERLRTQAVDEQRMEARYIARALGIQGSDIQDHNISAILAKLEEERKK